MSISMFILTFVNVWCLMLFFVLAFGVKKEPNTSPLEYAAAPQAFPWKKKLRLNTFISFGVTVIIALIIKSGIIPLHTLFDGL